MIPATTTIDSQPVAGAYGSVEWLTSTGLRHREDGPAVETRDGLREWYWLGKLHRVDGPAVIDEGWTQEWWVNGVQHRADGPAVIRTDGTQEWWVNGLRHRADGPAVIAEDGEQGWWLKGLRHRVGGPAVVEERGRREWWVNDRRHRLDGPAVEDRVNGYTHEEWWVDGNRVEARDLHFVYMLRDAPNLSDSLAMSMLSLVSEVARPLVARMIVRHESVRITQRTRAFASLTAGV